MPYSLTIIELNVQKRKTGMFSTVQGSIVHNCYTARNVIRRRTEALRGNVSSPGVDIINEVKARKLRVQFQHNLSPGGKQ